MERKTPFTGRSPSAALIAIAAITLCGLTEHDHRLPSLPSPSRGKSAQTSSSHWSNDLLIDDRGIIQAVKITPEAFRRKIDKEVIVGIGIESRELIDQLGTPDGILFDDREDSRRCFVYNFTDGAYCFYLHCLNEREERVDGIVVDGGY